MSRRLRLTRQRFSTMGCPAELAIYSNSDQTAGQALAIARSETERLDQKYSRYRSNSGLAALQAKASRPGGVSVDEETAALLNFAACQYQESAGCFDITSGRLSQLWERAQDLPTPAEIDLALSYTGWHKAGWDGQSLVLPRGLRLDLGGIVKEYAADRVALLLRQVGIDSGYIDLGGDLHLLGPHPDGRPWRVGIRHPRGTGAIAYLEVARGGLASSGDYERFRILKGQRYSHLINPLSGWPVQGLAGVSVQAVSCLMAGSICTLAMLLSPQRGLELLAESGLWCLAHDGSRLISPVTDTSV